MNPYPFPLGELVDLACRIQQIPSPTFYEQRRGEVVLSEFKHLNLANISQDPLGNVYACLPGGSGRPIILSAHLDTVHPLACPLELECGIESVSGPGIADNALGLAALISLAAWLQAEPVQQAGPIWFVANVREEGLGNLDGMRAVVEHFGSSPLAYLILEGIGLGKIFHRGLSISRYELSVETSGGHSWVDYGRPSAIHTLAKLIAQISSMPMPSQPRTTLNFGILKGGTSINTIAPNASAELDLRSENPAVITALVGQIQEIIAHTVREDVRVIFTPIGMRPAGEIDAKHPLVQLAAQTLRSHSIEPSLGIASTDANIPLSLGYPAICIGISTGSKTHTTQESLNIPPILVGMSCLYEIVSKAWTVLETN